MFDQTLLNSSRARPAIVLGYVLEFIAVGVLVLIPLIRTEALTDIFSSRHFIKLPSPPQAPAASLATAMRRKPTTPDVLTSPTEIPRLIVQFREEPAFLEGPSVGVSDGVPNGIPGGNQDGLMSSIFSSSVAPPPPPTPKPSKAPAFRVGGRVQAARLIAQPKPAYPPMARIARIQGVVELEATIGRDGTIQDLRVLQGHPLLVKAALEAVSRWRYQPTLLNGEPVGVVTEIDVIFTLAE